MASRPPTVSIDESDFPALYHAAERNSFDGQRRFLTAAQLRLVMLVVAAVFGPITWRRGRADLAAVVAGAAFSAALLAELYLLRRRPDRLWYDGRAAAESAKTLTWRYLVGGNPFGLTEVSEEEAELLLLHRFRQIAAELRGAHLVPISDAADQIGPALRRVRSLPLEERRALYRSGRIDAQHAWYRGKARWNERRATQWSLVLTGLEALGLGGAVLKAMGTFGFDLLGLASALVGAGAAWVQTKQHQNLASAYEVASQELAVIGAHGDWASDEPAWAHFVDQAEEAISREHTTWRASHT
jgi:SMODS and SLOG-associating 2TM effector domain 3/SMODS and SLOG-associating 2TM effector domain 1